MKTANRLMILTMAVVLGGCASMPNQPSIESPQQIPISKPGHTEDSEQALPEISARRTPSADPVIEIPTPPSPGLLPIYRVLKQTSIPRSRQMPELPLIPSPAPASIALEQPLPLPMVQISEKPDVESGYVSEVPTSRGENLPNTTDPSQGLPETPDSHEATPRVANSTGDRETAAVDRVAEANPPSVSPTAPPEVVSVALTPSQVREPAEGGQAEAAGRQPDQNELEMDPEIPEGETVRLRPHDVYSLSQVLRESVFLPGFGWSVTRILEGEDSAASEPREILSISDGRYIADQINLVVSLQYGTEGMHLTLNSTGDEPLAEPQLTQPITLDLERYNLQSGKKDTKSISIVTSMQTEPDKDPDYPQEAPNQVPGVEPVSQGPSLRTVSDRSAIKQEELAIQSSRSGDDVLFAQAQDLAAQKDLTSIKTAVSLYRRLLQEYPLSTHYQQARGAALQLERDYILVR